VLFGCSYTFKASFVSEIVDVIFRKRTESLIEFAVKFGIEFPWPICSALQWFDSVLGVDSMGTEDNDSVRDETAIRIHRITGVELYRCHGYLEHLSLAHLSKLFWASGQQPGPMFHDPLEDDPQIAPIIKQVEAEAEVLAQQEFERLLARHGLPTDLHPGMGRCHHVWGIMGTILRERHGIDWLSPARMNPWVNID
jgi:hypothetical protein